MSGERVGVTGGIKIVWVKTEAARECHVDGERRAAKDYSGSIMVNRSIRDRT